MGFPLVGLGQEKKLFVCPYIILAQLRNATYKLDYYIVLTL